MKKIFVTMMILAAVAVAPMIAASPTIMRINIPFDFVVSGKTLPAGQYDIADTFSPETVYVRGVNASNSAISIGNAGYAKDTDEASMAFVVADGKHYLVSVTHAGAARELPRPHVTGPVTLALLKAAR